MVEESERKLEKVVKAVEDGRIQSAFDFFSPNSFPFILSLNHSAHGQLCSV